MSLSARGPLLFRSNLLPYLWAFCATAGRSSQDYQPMAQSKVPGQEPLKVPNGGTSQNQPTTSVVGQKEHHHFIFRFHINEGILNHPLRGCSASAHWVDFSPDPALSAERHPIPNHRADTERRRGGRRDALRLRTYDKGQGFRSEI